MAIALAVVAVLLAGLMLTSGAGSDDDSDDDDGEAAAEPSTSRSSPTTTRRGSSTSRRPTTTTLPPPIAREPIGARLVMVRTGEVALVDIDANAITMREVPPLDVGAAPFNQGLGVPAVVRGGHLVFQNATGTWSVPIADRAPPRELAPSLLMLPAADPRDVWLVVAPDGRPAVQRWRGDGSMFFEPVSLPVDWAPVAEVDAGLVLRRAGQWQVWDPATATTVHAGQPDGRPLAAHGRMVAWIGPCDAPLCSLHLTDVVTGADRVVFLGAAQVDWGVGSFSPDGRYLAAPAYRTPSTQQWEPGFVVVDVAAGAARFEELSQSDGGNGGMAWSTNSRWLFLLSVSGTPDADIEAYSPDRDETVELQLPNRASGFAVVAY